MGQKSMSESFQRILLEFIVKGSFWDCVSRRRYRDKKTPNSNRINCSVENLNPYKLYESVKVRENDLA
jgi:hypothetical protein